MLTVAISTGDLLAESSTVPLIDIACARPVSCCALVNWKAKSRTGKINDDRNVMLPIRIVI